MSPRGEVEALLDQAVRAPEDAQPAPAASSSAVRSLEATLGHPLDPELIEWLRFRNGDLVGAGGIYGIRSAGDFLDLCSRITPEMADRCWIPVAGDGCGNHYVVDCDLTSDTAGMVLFVDQAEPGAPDYVAAPSVWRFLRSYLLSDLRRTSGPPDPDELLAHDPSRR